MSKPDGCEDDSAWERMAREYAKDCETLAPWIKPTAPKAVRELALGWISDDERERAK